MRISPCGQIPCICTPQFVHGDANSPPPDLKWKGTAAPWLLTTTWPSEWMKSQACRELMSVTAARRAPREWSSLTPSPALLYLSFMSVFFCESELLKMARIKCPATHVIHDFNWMQYIYKVTERLLCARFLCSISVSHFIFGLLVKHAVLPVS